MKWINLSIEQVKNKIDKELEKNSRYNGSMTKVKEKTATTKDILLAFVNEQRKFNKRIETKVDNNNKSISKLGIQVDNLETKVDNNTKMIKQAHPDLFK